MTTEEIINTVCTQLSVPKAELAKRMGMLPSSLYRKLARESMTLQELQTCLDVLDVSISFELRYPDGRTRSSKENHALVLEKLELLEQSLPTQPICCEVWQSFCNRKAVPKLHIHYAMSCPGEFLPPQRLMRQRGSDFRNIRRSAH